MILQTEKTLVGYRVSAPEDVGRYPADFVQVSLYCGAPKAMERMLRTVDACRSSNMPYVVHPVDYRLTHPDRNARAGIMEDVRIMARNADIALIVHDETMPDSSRLKGEAADAYDRAVKELSEICPVSVENSSNSHDIRWFWDRYARSITLDIGHLEAAKIDSGAFVKDTADRLSARLDFVHLHRVNSMRKGLVDHWGLVEGCKELHTLERVLSITRSCGIILEIIEEEDVEKSLELVRKAVEDWHLTCDASCGTLPLRGFRNPLFFLHVGFSPRLDRGRKQRLSLLDQLPAFLEADAHCVQCNVTA